jgi:hypothetical protein
LIGRHCRQHCEIITGDMAEKPGVATVLLRRIRLVRFAIALKWIGMDPTFGIKGDWVDG